MAFDRKNILVVGDEVIIDLALSESTLSTIFQLSPDQITITSFSDGTYTDVNAGYTRIRGYARDEVPGRSATRDITDGATEDRRPETSADRIDALGKQFARGIQASPADSAGRRRNP